MSTHTYTYHDLTDGQKSLLMNLFHQFNLRGSIIEKDVFNFVIKNQGLLCGDRTDAQTMTNLINQALAQIAG